MKATASFNGKAIGGTFSSIKSFGRSHHTEQWQERWPTGHNKAGLLGRQHQLTH